jgi:hypothetical protein
MKKHNKWIWLVIFLSVFLVWGQMPAMADEEKAEIEAELKPGFDIVDTSGESRKVGEYRVMDKGLHPTAEFSLFGNRENDYFDLGGTFLHESDQSYYLDADFRRIVKQEFSYDRFNHWLGHDPLENLNAVYSPADPHVVTTHTYYDIVREYHIINSEF